MKRLTLIAGLAVVALTGMSEAVHAQIVDRAVVRDASNGTPALDESSGTCVRTRWTENHDPCRIGVSETVITAEQQKPAPQQQAQISEDERTVYFEFNKAMLTPDARKHLDTLANDIKSRNDVKGAVVVGYADRIGTPSYNEKLSQKRAVAVKNYLVARGIVNASVAQTRWFGSSEPTTSCSNGESRSNLISCLQRDRRVEVEINYQSEVVANNSNQ